MTNEYVRHVQEPGIIIQLIITKCILCQINLNQNVTKFKSTTKASKNCPLKTHKNKNSSETFQSLCNIKTNFNMTNCWSFRKTETVNR